MKFILCTFLLIFTTSLNAEDLPHTSEPKSIDLWKDHVPGFSKNYQHTPSVNKDPERITEVNTPQLHIFPAQTKPNGKAIIIFPGGSYRILAYKKEGSTIAKHFAAQGYCCFVAHYRVSQGNDPSFKFPGPLLDARQSIRIVKSLAAEYQYSPDEVGIIGFSAGGHLAAMCATRFNEKFAAEEHLENDDVRPKFAALIYPVASMIAPSSHKGSRKALFGDTPAKQDLIAASPELQVKKGYPPIFIAHNQFDHVDATLSTALTEAYTKVKVPCALHLFPMSAHGFGMGRPQDTLKNQPAIIWPKLLHHFINRGK